MIYSSKTGKYLNQHFFTESWPGSRNRVDEIVFVKFDSAPLNCDPTMSPGKMILNIAKSCRIFPGKGRGDKDSFWHIWIAQWEKFFCTIFRSKRGLKAGPKVLTLDRSVFHKYSNPSKNFQTVFLFARVVPLVRISAILDYIGGMGGEGGKGSKTSQKGYFVDDESLSKMLESFNLTTANPILNKLTTIVYLHECKPE